MPFDARNVIDDDFAHQRFEFVNVSTGASFGTFDLRRVIEPGDVSGTPMNRAFQLPIENFLGNEVSPAVTETLPNHISDGVRHTSATERAEFKDKPTNATFNAHVNDAVRHITGAERTGWNDKPSNVTFNNAINSANAAIATKADASALATTNANLNAHVNDAVRHITGAERTSWDSKPTDIAFQDLKNRHNTLSTYVSEHVHDYIMHVTDIDRARWDAGAGGGITSGSYNGDGASIQVINIGFEPSFVVVFIRLKSLVHIDTGTVVDSHFGFASRSVASIGLDIVSNGFRVWNSSTTHGASKLNEAGSSFAYVAFR